uniref:E3 ubiquitin-protein ligase n=1 Tax=Timema genevievae TaxID=629358 RepID=A0A7R9PP48_TIMGE|nr:unnamed protein product [Timema genevievae]
MGQQPSSSARCTFILVPHVLQGPPEDEYAMSQRTRSMLVVDSPKNFRENLLSVLTCPRCKEYLDPPIIICETGHNLCHRCRPDQQTCTVCLRPLLDTRNFSLEGIAREVTYPCRYRGQGCRESFPMVDIAVHHGRCHFRVYNCPGRILEKCRWQGRRAEMETHLRDVHTNIHISFKTVKSSLVSWEITNSECYQDSHHFGYAFDEVFLFQKAFDVSQRKLCMAVKCLCPQDRVGRFRYQFRMTKNGGGQEVKLSSLVHHQEEEVAAVFQVGDCVRVDFDMLMSYVKGTRTMQIIRTSK